jgi:hypothetical protein
MALKVSEEKMFKHYMNRGKWFDSRLMYKIIFSLKCQHRLWGITSLLLMGIGVLLQE